MMTPWIRFSFCCSRRLWVIKLTRLKVIGGQGERAVEESPARFHILIQQWTLRVMLAQGSGSVVNVSSTFGQTGGVRTEGKVAGLVLLPARGTKAICNKVE
jgi:hypothetical protein